jgi:predicted Rdx family selenoprotein
MWAMIKLVIFIVTSLPSVIKALKDLYDLAFGEKKVVKACIQDICSPEHLKLHVDREKNKDKGPIR